MGLFDFLFHDMSKDWPEQNTQALVFDLRPPANLNGIRIGAPALELSQLGRPSNARPFKSGCFEYQVLGITAEIEKDAVDYFGFPLQRRDWDPVGPCELKVHFADGCEMALNADTAVATVLEHVPKPADVDQDEQETVYTIPGERFTMELEASPSGQLCRMNVFRAPRD